MGAGMDGRNLVNRPLRVATLGGLLLLGACGALLDLEPLTFEPAIGGEGGPDSGLESSSTDAPSDGGLPEATTRCSDGKRHDFCDDFEGIVGEIQDRWNKRKEVTGTGKIAAIATDAAPSPVTVFSSTIDRGPDGGIDVHIARLSKQESPWRRTDGGEQAGVRLAFEASFVALDDTYETTITNVTLGTSSIEDAIYIIAKREGGEAVLRIGEIYAGEAGVVYAGKPIATRVPLGQWTHFEVEIQERAPGTGGANVTVGTATTSYTLESTTRTTYFRADIGASIGSTVGAQSQVLYDNVRIDYLP